jgi:membrane fusion protein (multidrug efflux system)
MSLNMFISETPLKQIIFTALTLCFPLLLKGAEFSTVGNIYPSSKSIIASQVSGRIDHLYVEVGNEVKKGDPLLALDSSFFQIDVSKQKSNLDCSKIEQADAEVNFQRMKRLWEKTEGHAPSISLKKFEEAKIHYDRSTALVKKDEEELRRTEKHLEETIIRAPFDGVITKRFVDLGESIASAPPTSLFEIQSIHPVYLEFSVPQTYLGFIKTGTPVQFEIEGTEHTDNTAKIDLIYPCLDENTRSIRCRVILNNESKNILPGSFAKILIKGNTP